MAMETRQQRRRYLDAHNWAAMDTDILCSIFTRLPYVDLLRVNSTCWGWNAAIYVFKRCSATPSFPEIPWLIFTPLEDDEVSTRPQGEKIARFVNIEENKIYPFNDLALKKMNLDCCFCTGSSRDWLIFLDRKALPFLLNPFTSHRIDLPPLGVKRVYEIAKKRIIKNCIIPMVDGPWINGDRLVGKAVLSSSPSFDNNYYLVIIYGGDCGLAFCKDGDTSWTKLHSNPAEHYSDIIFLDNQLYGMYYSLSPKCYHIRIWDMNQDGFLLVKNINIVLEEVIATPPMNGFRSDLARTYLVESQGKLLLVTRFDMFRDISEHNVLCIEYTTSRFHVFKLDADQKLWRRLTSLSSFSLFLGKNQSISVDVRNCKMLKQDAIYFNSEFGYFPSVYSLKDDGFCWLYDHKGENRKSVSIWVMPPMKRLN